MKSAILCSALLLALGAAATASAAGPGQKYGGSYGGGGCNCGHCQQNGWANGLLGGHLGQGGHGHGGGYGYGGTPGYDISRSANYYAQWYGRGHGGAFGVPALAPPVYSPGPPTAAVTYPYYTTRGPRDFLMANPPPLGP